MQDISVHPDNPDYALSDSYTESISSGIFSSDSGYDLNIRDVNNPVSSCKYDFRGMIFIFAIPPKSKYYFYSPNPMFL